METIVDYIRWRQDIPFTVRDINEVDSVVFSAISYMDLKDILMDGQKLTVRACCLLLLEKDNISPQHRELYEALEQSDRFGPVVVGRYRDTFEEQSTVQFSCMLLEVRRDLNYIVFRGTDDSIAGWKEDFMTSFTLTQGQKLAQRFLEKQIRSGIMYDIGGHSKGGNLAMYALAQLEETKLKQVRRVYLQDAPGLCPDVMDISGLDRFRKKIVRMVPQYSVIGRLFENDIPVSYLVKSSADGIMQHDIETWGIDHGKIMTAEEPDPGAQLVNDTVASWLGDVSTMEREKFFSEIFSMIQSGGARRVGEIDGNAVSSVLDGLKESSPETRDAVAKIPMAAIFGRYADKIWDLRLVRWGRTSPVAVNLVLIALGLAFQAVPVRVMGVTVGIAIVDIALFQILITIRHLIDTKWDMKGERVRINLCIILAAFAYFMIVKDQALFNMSSLIFGIFFLIHASNHLYGMRREVKWSVAKVMHAVMSVMFAFVGLFVTLSEAHTVSWYAGTAGMLLILDGTAGLVHGIQKSDKTKKAGKAETQEHARLS